MSGTKEAYEITVVLQVTRNKKEYTKSDVFQDAKEILQGNGISSGSLSVDSTNVKHLKKVK